MSTDPAQKKRWEVVRRNETKELMPNLYWDWLLYLQQYAEKTVKGELALLRSRYPKMPMTIDVRAHRNSTDGYCAYDPAAIDGLVDLFFIHYHFTACQYNDTPVDLKTLLSQTCFPLFCVNYLRTNTTHPLVDSEDIVGKVTLPFSNNDAMVRNDIGGLHRSPWKFRLEGPGDDGLAGRWFACDHDDARWGDVTVPGAWDVQPEYKGKGGIAWYRKRFTCKVNVMDYLDGSHRYYILGKGVAQSGMVWLNGEKVGDVKGWDSAYKFDVGHLLKFGGENEIVWRVDGSGRENGLRFYCHVLANDMINETVSFGERQFKSMFWTYLMGGVSGELVWHWMDDAVRPYYPRVLAPIEAAAPIVLPSVRNRRSKVAYLYAYAASMALPSVADGEYVPWLNWYCALEFSGVRPDVVGEEMFVRDVTPKSHPLLVVPHAKVVKDETYESFKRYVRAGGRVLLTTNSFSRTMSRYRLTDLAAFAAENPDRVTLVDPSLEMPAIQELLKPLLPEQDVKISGGDVRETPVIERALVGDGDRRVLYLHNWGGLAQPLVVKIPAEFSGWTATDLEGHFVRTGGAEFQVEVPSQVPVALALTRPGAMVPSVTPFAAQEAMLRELADLQKPISDAQRKALFPKRGNPYTVAGKVLFPNWLRELRCRGVSVEERPFSEWKLETLREYALVVIPEPNSAGFDKLSDPAVKSALRIYVEQGGSLVVLAWSAHTVNASGTSLKQVGGLFGVSSGWGTACDPAHSEYGDPFQILTDVIEPGPLAKGVSHVQLCAVDPLSLAKDSPLKAVVKIPATAKSGKDGVVVAAGDVGRGRVVFSAEIMAFQPYRIEAADNARLLSNIIDWLLQ